MHTNKTYNGEDIQRYINGEMTGAEMHALEKAALDDPFLEDAISGYTENKTGPEDLADLQARLQQRVSKQRNVLPIRLNLVLRIAAIFIFITGTGLLIYRFLDKTIEPKVSVARSETKAGTQENIAPGIEDSVSITQVQAFKNEPKVSARKQEAPPVLQTPAAPPMVRVPRKMSAEKPSPILVAKEKAEETEDMAASKKDEVVAVGSEKSREIRANEVRRMAASKTSSAPAAQPANYTFQGQVLSTNQQPVEGAIIAAGNENEQFVTRSGIAGNFEFTANKYSIALELSAPGFKPVKAEISVDQNKPVFLLAADEQTASRSLGNAKRKHSSKMPSISFQTTLAAPVVSWTSYYEYLQTFQPGPDESHGEIVLTFRLDEKGKPVDISLLQTASPTINEQVMNLLKQGPAWKSSNLQSAQVKAIIRY